MPLKVAVLGMGRWGATWVRVLESEPSAVVESAAVRPGATMELPGVSVFDDLGAALDVDQLGAAIVTLPVELHLDAIRAAVARGVSVLCEKPAVASEADLAALETLAFTGSAVVRIDQNYRVRPWVSAVRAHLASIGSLQRVEVSFAQPEFSEGGRDRLAHPLLADMAIHHFDLLRHITGQEATVSSARATRRSDTTYSGFTDLEVEFVLASGARTAYDGTWAARGETTPWDGDWKFIGDRGSVTVRDLAVEVDTGFGPRRVATTRPPEGDSDLLVVWRDFVRAVDGDTSAGVSVADHARSLALIFDIARAAQIPDPWAAVSAGDSPLVRHVP